MVDRPGQIAAPSRNNLATMPRPIRKNAELTACCYCSSLQEGSISGPCMMGPVAS